MDVQPRTATPAPDTQALPQQSPVPPIDSSLASVSLKGVWPDEEADKFKEVVKSAWIVEQGRRVPSNGAQLWATLSSDHLEKGIKRSEEACRKKWYSIRDQPEFFPMFRFQQTKTKAVLSDQVLESVPEPNLTQDVINNEADEELVPPWTGGDRVRAGLWTKQEHGMLAKLMKARRDRERDDQTMRKLTSRQLFDLVSEQLKQRSIDQNPLSCRSYWHCSGGGYYMQLDACKTTSSPANESSSALKELSQSPPPVSEVGEDGLSEDDKLRRVSRPSQRALSARERKPASTKTGEVIPSRRRRFSQAQQASLKEHARKHGLEKPDSETIQQLAEKLGMIEKQITGWFGNARFKKRNSFTTALDGIDDDDEDDEPIQVRSSSRSKDIENAKLKNKRKTRLSYREDSDDDKPLVSQAAKRARIKVVNYNLSRPSNDDDDDKPHIVAPASKKVREETARIPGSKPGMFKRVAPMRDPNLPLLSMTGAKSPTLARLSSTSTSVATPASPVEAMKIKLRKLDAEYQAIDKQSQEKEAKIGFDVRRVATLKQQAEHLEQQAQEISLASQASQKDVEDYKTRLQEIVDQKKGLVYAMKIMED